MTIRYMEEKNNIKFAQYCIKYKISGCKNIRVIPNFINLVT